MAELTDQGYQIKTQNEWFEEERQRYLDIDPNWNVDVSAPDGLKIATDSEIWANLDEAGLRAYNSKDPSKATGIDLNLVCAITGTTRGEGTPSDVAIDITGTNGTVINDGALIESVENGSRWEINGPVTIAGGVASTTATAVDNGATQASIGVVTKIVSPQAGWATVTNPSVATLGRTV